MRTTYLADIYSNEIKVGDIIEFKYYGGSQYGRNRVVWVTHVDDTRIMGYDFKKVADEGGGCRNYSKNLIGNGFKSTSTYAGKEPSIKLLAGHVFKQALELRSIAPELATFKDVVFIGVRDMVAVVTPYDIVVSLRSSGPDYSFECKDGTIFVEKYEKSKK